LNFSEGLLHARILPISLNGVQKTLTTRTTPMTPRARRSRTGSIRQPDGTGWVVLADSEGNEFCVERSLKERAA
jgi:hypothetical protein